MDHQNSCQHKNSIKIHRNTAVHGITELSPPPTPNPVRNLVNAYTNGSVAMAGAIPKAAALNVTYQKPIFRPNLSAMNEEKIPPSIIPAIWQLVNASAIHFREHMSSHWKDNRQWWTQFSMSTRVLNLIISMALRLPLERPTRPGILRGAARCNSDHTPCSSWFCSKLWPYLWK